MSRPRDAASVFRDARADGGGEADARKPVPGPLGGGEGPLSAQGTMVAEEPFIILARHSHPVEDQPHMPQKAVSTHLGAPAPSSLVASCGRTAAFALRLVVLTIVFILLKAFFTLFRR
jgi:hypothetical protein